MAGNAVDIAVRRHHAGDPGVADGHLERQQLFLPKLSRPGVRGRLVESAFGQAMADEVLRGGGDASGQVRAL